MFAAKSLVTGRYGIREQVTLRMIKAPIHCAWTFFLGPKLMVYIRVSEIVSGRGRILISTKVSGAELGMVLKRTISEYRTKKGLLTPGFLPICVSPLF